MTNIEVVKDKVCEMLENKYEVRIIDVHKNNVTKKGLCITTGENSETKIGPVFYLDSADCDEYDGNTRYVTDAAEHVVKSFLSTPEVNPDICNELIKTNNLSFILVDGHQDLSCYVTRPFAESLAKILVLETTDCLLRVTGPLLNMISSKLGKTEDEIFEIAEENICKKEWDIKSMGEMLEQITGISGMDVPGFYIVTEKNLLRYGARMILNTKLLEDFSNRYCGGESFLIIPSSIMETIFVDERANSGPEFVSFLREMIASVNEEEVAPENYLSNDCFRYNVETGQVEIAV